MWEKEGFFLRKYTGEGGTRRTIQGASGSTQGANRKAGEFDAETMRRLRDAWRFVERIRKRFDMRGGRKTQFAAVQFGVAAYAMFAIQKKKRKRNSLDYE